MKTSLKIMLLVTAIALAVGGVLYYMKTIVSPPDRLSFDNRFAAHLDSVADRAGSATFEDLDTGFDRTLDKAGRFKTEGVIDDKESDRFMHNYLTCYAKLFTGEAYRLFASDRWPHERIVWLGDRMAMLREATLSDRTTPVIDDDSINSRLNHIGDVIDKYTRARKIAMRSGYTGLTDARNDITLASELMNDIDLQPNRELMSGLARVRPNRATAHVSYLWRLVNRLSYLYEFYNYDDYLQASNTAYNELLGYEQYGPSVYGDHYSQYEANSLRSSISTANINADNHFGNSYNSSNGFY